MQIPLDSSLIYSLKSYTKRLPQEVLIRSFFSDSVQIEYYLKFNGLIPVGGRVTKDGVIISIYVHPSAKQDRINTKNGIEIYTLEPPKGNKANFAVIKMLSRVLGIPRGEISIIRGATSRAKEIYIHGISLDTLERLMQSGNSE